MSTSEELLASADPEVGHFQLVEVTYSELDLAHVLHNSRYAVLLENAVMAYWLERGWHYDPARSLFPDSVHLVRAFEITYHLPITEVGKVGVHFWIERVGRTSYTYGFRVVSADRATLYAEGRRVQVNLSTATLTPIPLSAEEVAAARPLIRHAD